MKYDPTEMDVEQDAEAEEEAPKPEMKKSTVGYKGKGKHQALVDKTLNSDSEEEEEEEEEAPKPEMKKSTLGYKGKGKLQALMDETLNSDAEEEEEDEEEGEEEEDDEEEDEEEEDDEEEGEEVDDDDDTATVADGSAGPSKMISGKKFISKKLSSIPGKVPIKGLKATNRKMSKYVKTLRKINKHKKACKLEAAQLVQLAPFKRMIVDYAQNFGVGALSSKAVAILCEAAVGYLDGLYSSSFDVAKIADNKKVLLARHLAAAVKVKNQKNTK